MKEIKSVIKKMSTLKEEDREGTAKLLGECYQIGSVSSKEAAENVETMLSNHENLSAPVLSGLIFLFEEIRKIDKGDKLIRKFIRFLYRQMLERGTEFSQISSLTFLTNLLLVASDFSMRDKTVDFISDIFVTCAANNFFPEKVRQSAATAMSLINKAQNDPSYLPRSLVNEDSIVGSDSLGEDDAFE